MWGYGYVCGCVWAWVYVVSMVYVVCVRVWVCVCVCLGVWVSKNSGAILIASNNYLHKILEYRVQSTKFTWCGSPWFIVGGNTPRWHPLTNSS